MFSSAVSLNKQGVNMASGNQMSKSDFIESENNEDIPRLLTIRQMAEKHPFMSENSIRWLLFKDPPGLEECLIRLSKRIYIIESKYFKFLQDQKFKCSEP
jgi:hypothetical protein